MTKNRVMLIGAKGMLAQAVRKLAPEVYEILPFDLPDFDITDREQVLEVVIGLKPDVILNCAAYTNVDGCESEEEVAARVNGDGPGYLAEAARETDATLVHISTDYVFDGTGREPYREEDPTHPVSAYGRTKLRGEESIVASGLERFFIIRTSWLYGPGGGNFVETIIRLAGEREELRIVADQIGCPTFTEDLAAAIFRILEVARDGLYGIYHFSNEGACTWHDFAEEILRQARENGEPLKVRSVLPIRTEEYPLPARRPAFSVFSKEKYRRVTGAKFPEWKESLERYMKKRT